MPDMNKNNVIFVVYLFFIVFCFFPLANEIKVALAMIFTVFLWASTWLPEWLTALLFLSVCCICQLAPVDIVLSGFTSSSAWLVVSGIIISASIVHTGPGDNMGHIISPAFQGTGKRAITISVLFGLLASFVMPSAMNRIVLLIPVLDSIAKKSGYQAGDKG